MFDTIIGFSNQLLSAIVLVLCAGVTSHIIHGYGTKKSKDTFVGLVLLLAAGCQMYHIVIASVHINSSKYQEYNPHIRRLDCINSGKGGKRPGESSKMHYDENPCFCHANASCINKLTNTVISSNNTCDISNDDLYCVDSRNVTIDKYISPLRNCDGGVGAECTATSPCYPCDVNTLTTYNGGRCQACSSDNMGDCRFVPNVGPYCYESLTSKKVIPCKRCCTDSTPIFVDGVCY